MISRVIVIAFAIMAAVTPASALDPQRWERDVQLIERGVIQALDAEFLRSDKREDWRDYSAAFRQGIERFEGVIDPVSFQIMLEIHRQLEFDFGEIEKTERWQDASFYLRNKFGLVSFTLNAAV